MTHADAPGLWSGVELHIVTGKGGTGKTTVAAALALALAHEGQRTLLVEVEGRQGIAQLFDVPPLPYKETKVAAAPGGGEVFALAVSAEDALMEYLDMFYKLGPAGRALRKFGAIDFAATIAPGVRDVLLTGKVYEAVGDRRSGRAHYDAVILDAPPTGRITKFLNVSTEVSGLTRVGPIRHQADSINGLFASPRTVVHFVTLLEEMPVQEAADGVAEIASIGITPGALVVNQTLSADIGALADLDDHVDAHAVADLVKSVNLPRPVSTAKGLLLEGRAHAQRLALEARERVAAEDIGLPIVELPTITDDIDLGALYVLSDALRAQGMA